MKVVQMTLDEDLVKRVDLYVKHEKTTRSAFAREALELALRYQMDLKKEKLQRDGYKKFPVKKDEFDVWSNVQAWGD